MFKNEDLVYLGLGGLVLGAIVARLLNFNIIPVATDQPVTIQDVSEYAKDQIEKQTPIVSSLDKVLRESASMDTFGNGFIQQVGLMDNDRNTVKNDYYVKINSPVIYHEVE